MHYQDNNEGQQGQPQQPGQPNPPIEMVGHGWQVAPGVAAAVSATKPAARRWKWIGGITAAVVVLCCGGTALAGLADSGEQVAAVKPGPEITVPVTSAPVTSAPATTAPAEPEPTETEPEQEPDVLGLPLGATITATTSDGAVEITVSKSKKFPKMLRKSGCGDYPQDPDEGYYVVLDVKVEVVSGTGSINPWYFTFVDGEGVAAGAASAIFSGCGKPLDSGNDFPKGTKRSGQLVFDVASKSGQVEYGMSGTAASWKVG